MNDAKELIYRASSLSNTDPAKLALLEEAVALADAANDTELGYDARDELMDAAVFGGHGEKALVAFAWMLNAYDAQPDEYGTYNLYWKYKWVLNTARQFPQISASRIEGLISDFERRLESAGYSPRPALDARAEWARHRGDAEGAQGWFELWRRSKRDMLANCKLCEADSEVNHLLFLGETEEALRRAERIFGSGQRCASVPHATHATVLEPLFRLGQLEEAMAHHRAGYSMVKFKADFIGHVGEHIALLGLTLNFRQARTAYAKHASIALETKELLGQFDFQAGVLTWLLCEQRAGKRELKLQLSPSHPLHQETRLEAFVAFTTDILEELAARFDARNASDRFSRLARQYRELPERMTAYPIKASVVSS